MYINKIYLHAGLAIGSLMLSVIFTEENESYVNGMRYLFAIATAIYLVISGLIYTSIIAMKSEDQKDDNVRKISILKSDIDNPLPFPNPFDKKQNSNSKETVDVTIKEYDQHQLINNIVLIAIIAVVCLIYHLFKTNLLVLIWYSAFSLITIVTSPLFQTHILHQRVSRPFKTPDLRDDFIEIKKSIQQVQKEMKNELKQMGDDINGKKGGKK